MNVHFIAMGGAVMHNLALALHDLGHTVTGSDDEIYEPAKSRLAAKGILPPDVGWFPEKINNTIEAVIMGMHAKADNPELAKAREIGVRVYSFPEFIFEESKNKQRIVIAGSHGKTTITSMILHVLKNLGRNFDYLVGAQIEGFDNMVKLSKDAPVIILEGDEYLSSPIDRRPKFLLYKPHIALISGIAWDHINVFTTEEEYNMQFSLLVRTVPKAGTIIFNEEDKTLRKIVKATSRPEEQYIFPYSTPDFKIREGKYEVKLEGISERVNLIGRHNLLNLAGAWNICKQLSVDVEDFLKHISTFKGAAKRLEKIYEDAKLILFRDFAHAPSKVKATVEAVREFYPKKNMIACLELHTFSSLNKDFLPQYKDALKSVKKKIVFVNAETLKHKNYPPISREEIVKAFNDNGIIYVTAAEDLKEKIKSLREEEDVMLMMSSGNWGGMELQSITN